MSQSKKNSIKLLLYLGGLLGFVYLYFVVYNGIQVEIQETQTSIEEKQPERDRLEELYLNLSTYEDGIAIASAYINSELTNYPSYVSFEDFALWFLSWGNALPIDFNSITISNSTTTAEFPSYVDDMKVDMAAQRITGSTGGISLSYDQLKESLDDIYEYGSRTSLDTVNIAYDAETGGLLCDYSVSKYFVSYQEAPYDPLPLPRGVFGLPNPFRTAQSE